MDKKVSASLWSPLVVIIVIVSALVWVAGVAMTPKAAAASGPTFGIVPGDIAWLNMTVAQLTQVEGDDPTDSGYYIDVPVNITVKNQEGTLLENVTIIISGPHTSYENFTDATGTMTYTFNRTEITKGEEKIAVRASKPSHYPYAEKIIWVGYAGVLNMEQGNTAVDVLAASYGGSEMDISFTSVVVDTTKASSPEAGVNATAVVTDVVNIDTNYLYWTTDGDSGAQSGDSAFIPQSLITDEDGEATFGVHIEQENAGDVEITVEMTGIKESYMPTNSSSSITINANGNCFIATAAYGTPVNENLNTLRAFRDTILLTNPPGKFLVETYYLTSPPVANALSQSDRLRAATRVFLITPLVYFSAFCLNTGAAVAVMILILLVLVGLKRHRAVLLSCIGYGVFTIAAFTVTVFTLGALGYELPICAVVAADLLPLIIPVAVVVCVLRGIVGRKNHRMRLVESTTRLLLLNAKRRETTCTKRKN